MKAILIPISCVMMFIACGNSKKLPHQGPGNNNLPACLNEQLSKIQNHQYDNPPLQIDEYEYQDKRVFLFTADCCDQFNILCDENCHGFCAPSGGITGKGDGKCKDFDKEAKFVKTIWKK